MEFKVDKKLENLQKGGITEQVKYVEWAAPVVPILKSGHKLLRICQLRHQTWIVKECIYKLK